ncbi:MAG TPA: hypothetical protein VLE51_02340 [Candidatus Saccharimonadales bacterium]|nr:hypothetical protein [Candidatus Saccharimonadales bacterium]
MTGQVADVNRIQLLEDSLELAIGESDSIWSSVDKQYRLRVSICGFSSALVSNWLNEKAIENQMMQTTPKFTFDEGLVHVFTAAQMRERLTIIDPTYSQFLGYVGLNLWLDETQRETLYPKEKILVFPANETEVAVKAIASLADRFRLEHRALIEAYRATLERATLEDEGYNRPADWYAPLAEASSVEIEEIFAGIWDPSNITTFTGSEDLMRDASRLSRTFLADIPLSVLNMED